MPAVFVPTVTPQLAQQGFSTTPQADTRITSSDPSKNLDPVVKMAQAYEQFEQKQQEEQDTADALSASNNFTLEAQKRLVDLENKENDAAAEDYKTFDTDLIESQKKNGSNLNGRSLKLYNKLTQDKLVTLQAGGYAFNAKRANTQITQELVASADNASQQAVSSWGTPMFQANMNSLDESLKAVAVHQGIDLNSDAFKDLLRKGHADVYKAGIASQIGTKQFGLAGNAINQFAPEMDQFDVVALRTQLTSARIAEAEAQAQKEQARLNQDKENVLATASNYAQAGDPSKSIEVIKNGLVARTPSEILKKESLIAKYGYMVANGKTQAQQQQKTDAVSASTIYEQNGQWKLADQENEKAHALGLSDDVYYAKKYSISNSAVDEKFKFAETAFQNGEEKKGSDYLADIGKYTPYISDDRMQNFMLKVTQAKSESFTKVIDELSKVSPNTALELIERRGTRDLTAQDYAKVSAIQQRIHNADHTSYIDNLITEKNAKALGQALFNDDGSYTKLASDLQQNDPTLLRKAITQWGIINREASEDRIQKIQKNKGLPPDEINAYTAILKNRLYLGDPDNDSNDGLINATLRERKIPITKENQDRIRRELDSNANLQAEIDRKVKAFSDAEYRRYDFEARREFDNTQAGVNLVNQAIVSGKVNRADLSSVASPMSLLPDVQKQLRAMYDNTEEGQKQYEKVIAQIDMTFSKDVLGNAEKMRDIQDKIPDYAFEKTEGEFANELTTYQRKGILNRAQVDTLSQEFKSAQKKRYDKSADDTMGAIKDLLASALFNENKYSDCDSNDRAVISSSMTTIMQKARQVMNYSNDPRTLIPGLKLALTDPKLQNDIGISRQNAKTLIDTLGNEKLSDLVNATMQENQEPKFTREITQTHVNKPSSKERMGYYY